MATDQLLLQALCVRTQDRSREVLKHTGNKLPTHIESPREEIV